MYKTILYIVIVILLVIVGGEYYYFHNKYSTSSQVMMTTSGNHQMMMGRGGKGMPPGMAMSMAPVTPPLMNVEQTQQLTTGSDKSSTKKTFNIIAGNYYFVPNKITVNKGDQVTFVMTNAGGVHDLFIDALGVKIPINKTGETSIATFIASKAGTYQYYCSVPGHKAKGMWGTLIVQ